MSFAPRFRPVAKIAFWSLSLMITVVAVLPGRQLPPALFDWWDKAQHFSAFLVLAGLGFIAYQDRPRWLVAAGLAGLGMGIEIVQTGLTWRYGDGWDFAADCLGIAAAWGLWHALSQRGR